MPVGFTSKKFPSMIFDHKKMIGMGKERLAEKVATHPIGFELLPGNLLLKMQKLYETIYETSFDKRNWLRKILSPGILIKLDEKKKLFLKKKKVFYIQF